MLPPFCHAMHAYRKRPAFSVVGPLLTENKTSTKVQQPNPFTTQLAGKYSYSPRDDVTTSDVAARLLLGLDPASWLLVGWSEQRTESET
jgi:hypothetical protein